VKYTPQVEMNALLAQAAPPKTFGKPSENFMKTKELKEINRKGRLI